MQHMGHMGFLGEYLQNLVVCPFSYGIVMVYALNCGLLILFALYALNSAVNAGYVTTVCSDRF